MLSTNLTLANYLNIGGVHFAHQLHSEVATLDDDDNPVQGILIELNRVISSIKKEFCIRNPNLRRLSFKEVRRI